MKIETIMKRLQKAIDQNDIEKVVKLSAQLTPIKEVPPKKKKRTTKKSVDQPTESAEDAENIDESVFQVKATRKPMKKGVIKWKKPTKLDIIDTGDAQADIALDAKLKPKKLQREIDQRPAAKQVKIKCPVCNKERLEWAHNLHYFTDEFTKEKEIFGARCNSCESRR